MVARIKYPVGRAWIEVEAQSVKDAMRDLSEYAEVFGETVCGVCQSDKVTPEHRVAKGYDFYSMVCQSCGAKLDFGQTREGERLFPKRKDRDNNEIGKQGWNQYQYTQQSSGEF